MGYIPPRPAPWLNLDRHGLPRDYATYMWLLYGKHVKDQSPVRLAAELRPMTPDVGRRETR